jgi:hypothetical protein
MEIIEAVSKLPKDLIIYTYEFLDFQFNTYVIRTGKKNNKLILIQKPIWRAMRDPIAEDDIFFIT